MANATAKTETVVVGVTLELSLEEATALADIMQSIGGHPLRTRRGLTDNVAQALREAGVLAVCERVDYEPARPDDLEGAITFNERPRLNKARMR